MTMIRRSYRESRIQQAIVTHFRRTYEGEIVHVGNGGRRGALEAIRLNDEGVVAGHPDLVIYTPGGRTFLMEVKAESGSLSLRQRAFIRRLQDMAYDVATVHSLEEATRAFEAWGLPLKQPRARSEAEIRTGF